MSLIIVKIYQMASEWTNAIQIKRGLQMEFVLERMDIRVVMEGQV